MLFALVRGFAAFSTTALSTGLYESGKVVSAVCRGPAGLLEVKLGDGDYLISRKDAAGFS